MNLESSLLISRYFAIELFKTQTIKLYFYVLSAISLLLIVLPNVPNIDKVIIPITYLFFIPYCLIIFNESLAKHVSKEFIELVLIRDVKIINILIAEYLYSIFVVFALSVITVGLYMFVNLIKYSVFDLHMMFKFIYFVFGFISIYPFMICTILFLKSHSYGLIVWTFYAIIGSSLLQYRDSLLKTENIIINKTIDLLYIVTPMLKEYSNWYLQSWKTNIINEYVIANIICIILIYALSIKVFNKYDYNDI